MSKRRLIIIPGIGDRGRLYSLITPIWRWLGFDVHIFVFHWGDKHLAFDDALNGLLTFIDKFDSDRVYIIGTSAGGTAAINALSVRPQKIDKVVTVCTPHSVSPYLRKKLLIDSINIMNTGIMNMSNQQKTRILSMYGFCDPIVPYAKSKPVGINIKRVLFVGHGLPIFVSLTAYGASIRRFLLSN